MGLVSGTKRSVKAGLKSVFTGTGLIISIIYGLLILIIAVTNVFSIVIAVVLIILGLLWAITESFVAFSYKAGVWFKDNVIIDGGGTVLDFTEKTLDSGAKFATGIVDASTDALKQEFAEGKRKGASTLNKMKLYAKIPVWKYKVGNIIVNTILESRKKDKEAGMALVDKMFDDLADIRVYIIGELVKYE